MSNKEIILEFITAFDKSDTEAILSRVTDNMEWHMLGDPVISGKENMRKMFESNKDVEMMSSTKDHIIVDGDTVAVNGEVQFKMNGEMVNMYYCDIYELENGKVKKMITYSVNKK